MTRCAWDPPCRREAPNKTTLCTKHRDLRSHMRARLGHYDLIDAAAAASHLAVLRGRGWPWMQIAKSTRTYVTRIIAIHDREFATVERYRAEAILAIEPAWQATRVLVPTIGTLRRMSAMSYDGWPMAAYAPQIGLKLSTLRHIKGRPSVFASTAAAVAQVFTENAFTLGPDPQLAKRARTRGAIPASAWDLDRIDDPWAAPRRDWKMSA
jgi:hypothetical protein